MGVTKQLITPGDGTNYAKAGDTITMEYTGYLQDTSAPDGKGKKCVFDLNWHSILRKLSHEISQIRFLYWPWRLYPRDWHRRGHQRQVEIDTILAIFHSIPV